MRGSWVEARAWRRIAVAGLLGAPFAPARAWAQAAPERSEPAAASPPSPAEVTPDEREVDALVEELLSSGAEDDDIAWLFSDAAEYAEPSSLVGKPVPVPALPERGEGLRRTWDPRWRRFGPGNYVLTGVSLAVGLGATLLPPSPWHWRRLNELDESVRRELHVSRYSNGELARDASDLLVSVLIAYPLLFDSVVVMSWYRQSPDVGRQMTLITQEAVAVTSAIHGVASVLASRERPYGRHCGSDLAGDLADCSEQRRFRSFFSSHAALGFAAAGVACTHHSRHDVYGNPVADGIACGAAVVMASAVGTLRLIGDQHYATDVLVGAGVGVFSGIGLPWILHYETNGQPRSGTRAGVRWNLALDQNGVALRGSF